MLADVGSISLALGLTAAVYSACAAAYGLTARLYGAVWVESARRALVVVWGFLSVSVGAMVALLLTGDMQVEYVATVTSRSMHPLLQVAALWGGQAGSLLFWAWVSATFSAMVVRRRWNLDRPLLPYVTVVSAVTQVFYIMLVALVEVPFRSLAFVPTDGVGLNPLLRHPGMIIHPPLLYVGYVGFTVPYFIAMAALISGRLETWIYAVRRWVLVAWLFLSLGLVLGGRWAYDVLGWGGYWAWDPVENAALLPWLTATAFLHSAIIQERRSAFKMWNMALIALTYGLVVLGVLLTRSGIVSSVHAFSDSSIGGFMFGYFALMGVTTVFWLLKRTDALRSEFRPIRLLSRETVFLANNVLLLSITATVLYGTLFPLFTRLLVRQTITLPAGWYDQVVGPQFAALVLLMGVVPLLGWGHTRARRLGRAICLPGAMTLFSVTGLVLVGIRNVGAVIGFGLCTFAASATLLESWHAVRSRQRVRGESVMVALQKMVTNNRRRYGGYLVHLAIVLVGIGITGSHFYQQEAQGAVGQGQSLHVAGFAISYGELSERQISQEQVRTEATVAVYRDNRHMATLWPASDYYPISRQVVTVPAVRSTLAGDLYVILVDWSQESAGTATLKVYYNPLMSWLWIGACLLTIGTAVAAWPERRDQAECAMAYRAGALAADG